MNFNSQRQKLSHDQAHWNPNPEEELIMANDPTSRHPGGDNQGENQGEGDRESAERYNEATHEFVQSGKVDDAAEHAAGQDPQEARRSEREAREHAKEEDPAVHRDYDKPVK
jgi:hypothetical protein